MNKKHKHKLEEGVSSAKVKPASAEMELLEITQSQWEKSDWKNLATIDLDAIVVHPDRTMLSVFSAVAHLQLGDSKTARKILQGVLRQGIKKKDLATYLVSGACNNLGRAAEIIGKVLKSERFFSKSIELANLSTNSTLSMRMGIENDLSGRKTSSFISPIDQRNKKTSYLSVENIAKFNLGMAWAANTINTVIFRHHGVVTWKGFQYTAFYANEHILRMVQRELDNNSIVTCDIAGEYNLSDAHNSISIGVDNDNYIHISYDHHATKLRYRRSSLPNNIGKWTDELAMTRAHEEQITYPTFILPRAGYPLTLLYRDGVHNKGSARLKTYDEKTLKWSDRPKPILCGADHQPWTSNAYWNHPVIGSDGSLHLSFVWRNGMLGEQHLVNNVNISYAWSPDNGLNWFTSLGQPYKLPITQVNAETVWPISPGSNLINQSGMALDSNNRPHIVFYANDKYGVVQYQHVWFDGQAWKHNYFSSREKKFNLTGRGTLQIPISRPEILIDRSDNVYFIYRADFTEDYMVIALLHSSMIKVSDSSPVGIRISPSELGYCEPVIDRTRWDNENILTILMQKNYQPDHDNVTEKIDSVVWLMDFKLH